MNGYDSIIDYLDTNPGKKVVINMSFGGGNWAEELTRLASIRAKGGISIAAAGNENQDASNVSPASSADTITVGAIDQSYNKASFSNYGNTVDIWAPGTNIKSSIPGEQTAVYQGTSMAAPLVAGIVANFVANNPSADFDDIIIRLLDYAMYDVDDGFGNTNLPRVQASCEEYAVTSVPTNDPTNDPTAFPTWVPISADPTIDPTAFPTLFPTWMPISMDVYSYSSHNTYCIIVVYKIFRFWRWRRRRICSS